MPDQRRAPTRLLRAGAAEIRVFDDQDALISAAAHAMLNLKRHGQCHLALAGGSTPEALYRRLADDDEVDWARMHVWFGDERCVGPDHPDSNYRMAQASLLDQVSIAPERVHRMRGELSPDDAAQRYQDELRAAFGEVERPRFDLILLGVGEDGHTASLFPGTTAIDERQRWVVPNFVEKLDTWRVTLTLPVLCSAQRVWIFAVGARKAAIVRDVLGTVRDAARWPVQAVVPAEGQLVWWLDEAAATGLG